MEQLKAYRQTPIVHQEKRSVVSTISSNEFDIRRRRVDSSISSYSNSRSGTTWESNSDISNVSGSFEFISPDNYSDDIRYNTFKGPTFPSDGVIIPRARVNPSNSTSQENFSSKQSSRPSGVEDSNNSARSYSNHGYVSSVERLSPSRQYIPRVNMTNNLRSVNGEDHQSEGSSIALSPLEIQRILNGNLTLGEGDNNEYRWDFNVDHIDTVRRFRIQRPKVLLDSIAAETSQSSVRSKAFRLW